MADIDNVNIPDRVIRSIAQNVPRLNMGQEGSTCDQL